MQTNDDDRDQQIIQAMCDYATQLNQPNPILHIGNWLAANVQDTRLHEELAEAIELSLALGPVEPVTELTPHEQAMADRSAERVRQRWRERVAALQRGDY